MATTTSTRDTGLLDELVPRFTKESGIEVKVIAVGSGQALELGRRGDADVLLTHSPDAEDEYMAAGYGTLRLAVMQNEFVLVGPTDDPAGIRNRPVEAALQAIAAVEAPFISRGDESGTHTKELSLWKMAKLEPAGAWYIEAGSGMAEALRMADQKQAYTLSDRGTFMAQQQNLGLAILVQKNPPLKNHYSVIVVNPQQHQAVDATGAAAFARFLVAPETQQRIAEFGRETYGEPLFYPEAATSRN